MTLKICYLLFQNRLETQERQEVIFMKGYYTAEGYMGLVEGRYFLFACEADYREYLEAYEEE